jgi:alkaline phosphatase
MPSYVYEVVLPDGTGGEQFEVFQKMADGPLTTHPDTGEPVRRVFVEPNAPRAWTDTQGKAAMSDSNLAAKGFTKYVKTGNGTYEKTAGSGPKKLKRGK